MIRISKTGAISFDTHGDPVKNVVIEECAIDTSARKKEKDKYESTTLKFSCKIYVRAYSCVKADMEIVSAGIMKYFRGNNK